MQLKINKVTVKGFKGYFNEVEFPLGYRTLISGDNGMGKSSIGDAIAWSITGCDINGNEKVTGKLVNDKRPKVTEVILEFEIDGMCHVITRRKNSSTEVYLDDSKVTSSDLSRDLYKDKNIFLSIFNPSYFVNLTPKDAKNLLSSVLKPITKEDIFKELGEFLREKLIKNNFRTPEIFLSDKRAELREQEENIIFLEGVIEGAIPIEIPERKVFDDKELKKLEEELKSLKILPEPTKVNKLKEDRKVLEKELSSGFKGREEIDLSIIKAKKDSLLKQYKDLKKKIENLGKNIVKCYKCGNEIDINDSLRESLKEELERVLKSGKLKRAEIDKIEGENEKIKEENKCEALKWENLVKSNIEVLDTKIKELSDKTKSENKEAEEKLKLINERIEKLKELKNQVLIHNSNIDSLLAQNEKINNQVKKSQKEIENSKFKIAELKAAIDAGKQYNSIKLKKQSEMVGQYLDKVKLQFERLNKDGEIKDDFKILYGGREFSRISNAEKIKAGIEISNFIANMMDLHFPIFIDNAESITEICELETQMIIAKVSKGKKLEMEVIK